MKKNFSRNLTALLSLTLILSVYTFSIASENKPDKTETTENTAEVQRTELTGNEETLFGDYIVNKNVTISKPVKVSDGKASILVASGGRLVIDHNVKLDTAIPASLEIIVENQAALENNGIIDSNTSVSFADGAEICGKFPDKYTLNGNISVSKEKSLFISEGETVNIPKDKFLIISGSLNNNGAIVGNTAFERNSQISGKLPDEFTAPYGITVPSQNTLTTDSGKDIAADIIVRGKLINNGTLTGNITFEENSEISGKLPKNHRFNGTTSIPADKSLTVPVDTSLNITNNNLDLKGSLTVDGILNIGENKALNIPKDKTVVISNTLENNGIFKGEGSVFFSDNSNICGNMPEKYILNGNINVPADKTLKISKNQSISIPSENSIIVSGTLENQGQISGSGPVVLADGSKIFGRFPSNYLLDGNVTVPANTTLTVEENQSIEILAGRNLIVSGTLKNLGTVTGKVIFKENGNVTGNFPADSVFENDIIISEDQVYTVKEDTVIEKNITVRGHLINNGTIKGKVTFENGSKLSGKLPDNYAVVGNIIVPAGESLNVPSSLSLNIESGKTLTLDGTLDVYGALENNGIIAGSGKVNFYNASKLSGKLPANYTFSGLVTVPHSKNLALENQSLTIPSNVNLKVDGILNTSPDSYIQIEKSGTLTVLNNFVNYGIIAVEGNLNGDFRNSGKIYNLGNISNLKEIKGYEPYALIPVSTETKRLMYSNDAVNNNDKDILKKELNRKNASGIKYFDIKLIEKKNGKWTELNEAATVKIPYPANKNSYDFFVVHKSSEKNASFVSITKEKDYVSFKLPNPSACAIGYKKTSSSNSSGGSDRTPHSTLNNEFWEKVNKDIKSLKKGDVIKVDAGSYTDMPFTTMEALRKQKVSMVVKYDGGSFTIPAGKALKDTENKVYYPLEDLDEIYKNANLDDAVLDDKETPQDKPSGGEIKPVPDPPKPAPPTPTPKPPKPVIPPSSSSPSVEERSSSSSEASSQEESSIEESKEESSEESVPAANNDDEQKQEKKDGFPLWIVFLILALLTGGIGLYFFIKSRMYDDEEI